MFLAFCSFIAAQPDAVIADSSETTYAEQPRLSIVTTASDDALDVERVDLPIAQP